MQLDVRITQLLCSRLCHDLVGSASAINAGLELIDEDPGAPEEPLDLMRKSADQINRRLAFFRVAFGLAEGANGPAKVSEIRALAAGMLGSGKVSLDWPDSENYDRSKVLPAEIGKVCLNLLLAASECLPRGGTINVRLIEVASGTGIAIEAQGQNARISGDMASALNPAANIDRINAYNVHVYYAQSLSRDFGSEIECQVDSDRNTVQIAVVFPGR